MIYDLKVNKKYIRRETNLARLSFRQVKKSVMIGSLLIILFIILKEEKIAVLLGNFYLGMLSRR